MNSEAEIIIAFVFKRSGKTALTEPEIYLPLSLELGWFPSQQAKSFVTYALKQKLLVKKGALLSPTFDSGKITIPLGFHPTKTSFEAEEKEGAPEEKAPVLDTIIHRIREKTKRSQKDIIAKIREIEQEKKILSEVAALVVAKEYDVDVTDFLDKVDRALFRESEE